MSSSLIQGLYVSHTEKKTMREEREAVIGSADEGGGWSQSHES
jgi:hypothetical protein